MQHDVYERGKAALHDYLIWLRERGDKSDQYRCHGHMKKFQPIRASRTPKKKMQGTETKWFKKKEAEWKESGRISSGGYLTISENNIEWTLEKIGAAFPQLNYWDKLAALYLLDGVVSEVEMADIKLNIREVFDEMVEMKVARLFSEMLQAEKHQSKSNDNLRPLNYRKTNKTAGKERFTDHLSNPHLADD